MKDHQILIIGGYGNVGRLIALEILKRRTGRPIIAGRNFYKAERVAREIGMGTGWTQFDAFVFDAREEEEVRKADVIVVCIDQTDTRLAAYCVMKGKKYVDITANPAFIQKITQLNDLAVKHRGLALMSVGLCPGLTNLVSVELKRRFPQATAISTGLVLALGETHGRASVEWVVNTFVDRRSCTRSFVDSSRFRFQGYGSRTAYRFNFADQHALKATFPKNDFSTYLCFDSRFLTTLFHLLKLSRMDLVLRVKPVKSVLVSIASALAFGKKGFAGQCVARETGSITGSLSFYGEHTGAATAEVTAMVVQKLLSGQQQYGVKHIHEVFGLSDVYEIRDVVHSFVIQ